MITYSGKLWRAFITSQPINGILRFYKSLLCNLIIDKYEYKNVTNILVLHDFLHVEYNYTHYFKN